MDRGAWWAPVHRVTKSRTQLKRLNTAQMVKNACLTPPLYFQPSPFSIGFAVPITAVNKQETQEQS